jgi:site-specific recombinase
MESMLDSLVKNLKSSDLSIIEKLTYIIDFIRPADVNDIDNSIKKIHQIVNYLNNNTKTADDLSACVNRWLIKSRISTNISNLGILSRDGFLHELNKRFYNKFLPSPPKEGDFKYLFATLFYKNNDHIWVNAIENEIWIEFFSTILYNNEYSQTTKDYLFDELLYAVEILSIWIASEEFDENFIRIDSSLLNKDSAFIELHRSISSFITVIQKAKIDINSTELDFQHTKVILKQCHDQVSFLKKKSINKGISVALTYELERLEQIIQRVEDILELIKKFDTPEFYNSLIELFKESVQYNSKKNSIYDFYNQNIKILAKSITNNASEHGEHYITSDKNEYLKMFFSAAGAGIIIAIMALLKINIYQLDLSLFSQTFLSSLNYGLGFVLIHMLGFTIATKQPAMTASTFAKAIEKEQNNKANQLKLVELIFQVSRSQFAAVMGNVILALSVAFVISFFFFSNDFKILSVEEKMYYLEGIKSYSALFYAAIAGIWLFCSGLIAGYFDNRANYLNLKERYFYHPFFKKYLSPNLREKTAEYLYENHGAMAGNFFFGILLGITPFLGYLFNLPLEIRHVAFSTANLGYCSADFLLSLKDFFIAFVFVFMIGFVNLSVSFILALKISLKSRDAYFGSVFSFLKLLATESLKRPWELLFPIKKSEKTSS